MHISIVVPFYNEAGSVGRVQSELLPVAAQLARSGPIELVFVDDGSTDGSLAAFRDAIQPGPGVQVRFEQHPQNRGLGAALRTGFAAACGEVMVTTDSDGTYAFAEIPGLLACLGPDVDLVTASPYHPRGGVDGVPGYRLLLSRGSSLIYRLLVDRRLHTYTSLFRAYRRALIDRVSFQSSGFLAGTEILVKALLLGFRAAEHPAVLHSRAAGVSKAKLARTTLAHLRFQSLVLLHRLGLRPLVAPRMAEHQGPQAR
jgi:dolichol-phosphate mannosyltransferase